MHVLCNALSFPSPHERSEWRGAAKQSRSRPALVIARSDSDEAIQKQPRSHRKPPWIASLTLAMTQASPFSRCAFCSRPEGCPSCSRTAASKKGGGAPKGALVAAALAQQAERRLGCASRRAAPFGSRARLPALYRGSRQKPCGLWLSPVSRFMVADNRSAPRAASSWQTGDVAGRASFRTARGRSYEPHPGHRSRSHQSAVTG